MYKINSILILSLIFFFVACGNSSSDNLFNNRYFINGTQFFNYKNNLRIKNQVWLYKGQQKAKINWRYYYKENKDSNTLEIYYTKGKYYFNGLKEYLEIDERIDQSKTALISNSCNNDDLKE